MSRIKMIMTVYQSVASSSFLPIPLLTMNIVNRQYQLTLYFNDSPFRITPCPLPYSVPLYTISSLLYNVYYKRRHNVASFALCRRH
uniref:Secreted protein n=1 Tax=Caenorhabditis tropicalis TaxID=1561998 RepID=A0A1I7TE34_9PELO